MATSANVNTASAEIVISTPDILFECPSCGKSLVVDEAAQGLTVECPKCHINVIVPPKERLSEGPPSSKGQAAPVRPLSAPPKGDSSRVDDLQRRLASIISQLKELQTQRTELSNRIASRSNEMNRDLVLLARLDTSQQQVLGELNRLVQQIVEAGGSSSNQEAVPTVVGASAGRPRVSFGG